MKLLICTQKIDINDPILGFFHRWVVEFANYYDEVTVICLQKGNNELPANVRVFSLGKEDGVSHIQYLSRFFKYIIKERHNYDSVFVHMNEEYVILGGLVWFFLRKKVGLWRNHASGSWRTWLAVFFSYRVFFTSPFSFTARYKKGLIMPVGVDTVIYQGKRIKSSSSIMILGRISPVKRIMLGIEALKILDEENIKFSADIIGDPISESDIQYKKQLKDIAVPLGDKIRFIPSVVPSKSPAYFLSHDILLNLTNSGSLDKTIIEAMSSGTIPLMINRSLSSSLSPLMRLYCICEDSSPRSIADGIKRLITLNKETKSILRKEGNEISLKHDIKTLIPLIMRSYEGNI